MAGIGFNSIPGQGLTAPIFAFEVNSGGQYDSASRLVLLGHKTTAGSLADNTPSVVASQQEADALAGPGSMLREMYRIARANAPVQEIYVVPVPATGVAQVSSVTIASLPAAGGVGVFRVCGEEIAITIGAGDSATTIAAAVAAAISGYYNTLTAAMLPVTATSSAGVVTIAARHAGALGAEIAIEVPARIGNVFAAANVWTLATVTPGSGIPSLAAALAALADNPADLVVGPWADATSLDAYGTTMSDGVGRWGYSRQSYGHVIACNTGNTSAQTTLGLARNDRHVTILPRPAGASHPSWLWAAGFAGRVIPWLSDCVLGNVSRNQTGLVVEGLSPPADPSAVWGYGARNVFLNSGISTWNVTADGKVAVDKLVTTYRLGVLGQPDAVFRDIQALFQVAGGLKFIRSVMADEHGQKAIADTNPGNLAAISTPSDVKATAIHAYANLCARGVFEDEPGFTRRVIARRNVQNPARIDLLMPMDRVNPLDILAANATIYAQYPV